MLNFEEDGKVTALSGLGLPQAPGFVPAAPEAAMPPSEGTAFSAPALLVDFSACVAPMARR